MVVDEDGRYCTCANEPVLLTVESESGEVVSKRLNNPVIMIDNAYARSSP